MRRIVIVIGAAAALALGVVSARQASDRASAGDAPEAAASIAGGGPSGAAVAGPSGRGAADEPAAAVGAADPPDEPGTPRADAARLGRSPVPAGERRDGDAPAQPGAAALGPAGEAGPAGAAAAGPTESVAPRDAGAGEADPADARAVLRRAASAYERVESLQADFTMRIENPLLRSTTESRGTLFQRRPDRFLMRFSEPEGDVIVSDGAHIWVFYPSANPNQVIRTRGGAGGAGGMDLQAQFLGDPLQRFDPESRGSERVGGREADVLVLTPKEDVGYRSLTIWVDRQDGLVRRFEIAEANGNVRRVELSGLRTNHRLADDLFRFTPPEGVRVIDQG